MYAPTSKLTIVKALLSKTVANNCTPSEEAAAVAKAVEMMGRYALPHSAVASVWPKGWDFHGKRVASQPRVKVDLHAAANAFVNEALRRAATTKPQPKPSQGAPGTIGNYARDLLMRNISGVGPYSYGYILGRIMDRYPDAKTTVASLRWYENEMRKQGREVPKKRPAKG